VTNTKVSGYWAIGSDGRVYGFGDAIKTGEPVTTLLNTVDIEGSPHGTGYWTLNDRGAVNAYGPIGYGSLADGDLRAGERAVSMSSTPSGAGYWIFTNKGRAIGFGDADKNIGDVSKIELNQEVLDSAATPSGKGYYLVAADGGVFALGDAKYEGSMGDKPLNKPVLSIVPDPDGQGYWLVASDGGVFAFKAIFLGSTGNLTLNEPMTGMVPFGNGYLMVAEDGGVFNFSDKPFSGSTGNNPPAVPMMSITVLS
jgi:ribosomal protein L24E